MKDRRLTRYNCVLRVSMHVSTKLYLKLNSLALSHNIAKSEPNHKLVISDFKQKVNDRIPQFRTLYLFTQLVVLVINFLKLIILLLFSNF